MAARKTPATGRPVVDPAGKVSSHRVTVNLTEEQHARLAYVAKQRGVKVGALLRDLGLAGLAGDSGGVK